MAALEFVNRTAELSTLASDIQGTSNENRMVLLISAPGIGKSRLAKRLLQIITARPGIKVSIRAPKARLLQDGYYIRMLAMEIDEQAKNDLRLPSFKSFLRGGLSEESEKRRLKRVGRAAVDAIPVLKVARALVEGARLPVPNARDQFSSPTGENSLFAYEYVLHAMERARPIINIEQIQDIDETSLDLLKLASRNTRGQYFLFEYTTDQSWGWRTEDIREAFEETASVASHYLERLKVEDVLRIVQDQPAALEALVRSLYLQSNGSLRPLTDYFIRVMDDPAGLEIQAQRGDFKDLHDFTRDSFSALNSPSRLVLAALAIHGGWIERSLLDHFGSLTQFSSTLLDVDLALDDLEERSFIEQQDDRFQAAEGILEHVLSDIGFARERLLCLDAWKRLYTYAATGGGDIFIHKSEAFYFLVYFSYLQGDTLECAKYLDQVLYLAARSYVPTRFISFAKDIRVKLAERSQSPLLADIDRRLVAALQTMSYSEDALRMLDVVAEGKLKEAYTCILLENAGQAKEALERCNRALTQSDILSDPRWRLRFELSKFAALRSLLRRKECLRLFQAMRSSAEYKKLLEFGYVLRMAGSCLAPERAIPDLKKSAEIFKQSGKHVQEAYSRIELAVAFAEVQRLDEADLELDLAQELLDGQITERHTILNDRACTSILRGRTDLQTLDNLRQAFLTARNGFDKTAIRNNMLIALAAMEKPEAAEAVKEMLASCERGGFTSRELVCITYHNASVYYRQIDELDELPRMMAKLEVMRAELKPDWLPELTDSAIAAHKMPLVEGKPYCPVFLAHWTTELSGDD